MSLGKFLKNLWQGVKKFFQGLDGKLKELLPIVTNIVNMIKIIEDTNIPDILTAIIPGDLDDKLNAKFRELLPVVLLELEADAAILNLPTVEEKVSAILEKIKGKHPNAQKVFWTGLAALLMERIVDDGKFSFADAAVVSQYIYAHKLNLPEDQQEEPANDEEQ